MRHYYNTNEVGKILGVSRPTVYKLLDEHSIEVLRVGRHIKISHDEVTRLLKERTYVFSRVGDTGIDTDTHENGY